MEGPLLSEFNADAANKLWRSSYMYFGGRRVNQKERKEQTPRAGSIAITEEDSSPEDTVALDEWTSYFHLFI